MTTAIRSSGSRRRSRQTRSPALMVSLKTPAGARFSDLMWRFASTPTTKPTGASGQIGSSEWSDAPAVRPLSVWLGFNQTKFPGLLIWRGRSCVPACRSVSADFHVSGCIAMLPEMPQEMREAARLGISFFAGEAEHGRLDQVIRDAWEGSLQPLYNYMSDLPSLEGEPAPILPRKHVRRVSGQLSSLDLGRGCPHQCSFCTIINVQGRKSRFRSPDDLERAIRENYRQGNRRFFITDDNFARNRHWEPLFDRMIQLRVGEGLKIGFTIQVDTLCHRIPNFIEKAAQAGVRRVFIGLENINPDNLLAAKKRQNKITVYRAMLQKWHEHGRSPAPATSSDSPATRRNPFCATSRSSSGNCRSMCSSCSC